MAAWLGVFAKLQFEKKNGELPAVPRRFLLQDLWMQHKEGSRSWWDWPRLQAETARVPILRGGK